VNKNKNDDPVKNWRFENGDRVFARLDGEIIPGVVRSQRLTSKGGKKNARQRHLVLVRLDDRPDPVEFFESELSTGLVDLIGGLAE